MHVITTRNETSIKREIERFLRFVSILLMIFRFTKRYIFFNSRFFYLKILLIIYNLIVNYE